MSERKIVRENGKQYTEDTRTVATFLRRKGRSLGCPRTWLLRPRAEGSSKEADYVLSLPNCALIAKYLSENSKLSVPVSIAVALDRAIKLRIETTRMFQRRKEDDKEHAYAIKKLQKVQKFLEGKPETRPTGTSSK